MTLPAALPAILEHHLEKHVAASQDALLVPTRSDGSLARSNWNSTFRRASDAIGLPAVWRHELRHTGATLAAAAAATTKELMRRLGHSSPSPPSSTSTPLTTATPRSPVASTSYSGQLTHQRITIRRRSRSRRLPRSGSRVGRAGSRRNEESKTSTDRSRAPRLPAAMPVRFRLPAPALPQIRRRVRALPPEEISFRGPEQRLEMTPF